MEQTKHPDAPVDAAGMGAVVHDGGVTFRVWAPNADSVSVVGSFNEWDEVAAPMRPEANGYWALTIAEAKPGDEYKYVILNREQKLHRLDPYAREVTSSVGNSIIVAADFDWGDSRQFRIAPWNELLIYEMHIGTFSRETDGRAGTFQSASDKLPYLRDLGVNAVELMPPMEFPGGISWGYNPALPFAIESDYGGATAFKEFVKSAHAHGIAVILDVVYNHFGPSDLDLWRFDGWSENGYGGIYFYNDDRAQTPWGDTRPDYGRDQVRQYIRDNALMWLQEYDVDGLRWDATAYIRNVHGNDVGHAGELPEGWSLMQWINDEIDAHAPSKITIAEDLRNNEWLVKGTGAGGAGFGSQWDSEFVHPVRAAIITGDDEFRDLDAVQGALLHQYDGDAFNRIVYTESHDEVANGKARVTEEIWPGNSLHWFAKKRSTLGAMLVFTAPGIPMIFQGQEFLEDRWFDDQDPLDWQQAEALAGFVGLYRDLARLRRNLDGVSNGLSGQFIDVFHVDAGAHVMAYHRWADGGPGDSVVVVLNFAAEPVTDYRLAFPAPGAWTLRFDSHAAAYDPAFGDQVSGDVGAQEEEEGYFGSVSVAPYSGVVYSQ